MNGGAFGENFPYSNFHDLNMDWIIKIAKDFLDQYTHIQDVINQGLEDLEEKATNLEALLQAWYDQHSQDIANQLADALNDLNAWYIQHQGYLDQYLTDSITAFTNAANQKTAESIASIPSDYSELANDVNNLKNGHILKRFKVANDFIFGRYISSGFDDTLTNYARNRTAYPAGTYELGPFASEGFIAFEYYTDTVGGTQLIPVYTHYYTVTAENPFYITFTLSNGQTSLDNINAGMIVNRIDTESIEAKLDDAFEYAYSKNRFDGSNTVGGFVIPTTGGIGNNNDYAYTDFIDISNHGSQSIIISQIYSFANQALRYALYDENKTYISGELVPGASTQYNSTLRRFYVVIPATSNAKYIRFSLTYGAFSVTPDPKFQVEYSAVTAFEPYYDITLTIRDSALEHNNIIIQLQGQNDIVESMTYGQSPAQNQAESLSNGGTLIAESNSIVKNQYIAFFANITGIFYGVRIGHGQENYGYGIEINATQMRYWTNGSYGASISHTLTIESYIAVILKVSGNSIVSVTIITKTGSFNRSQQIGAYWKGNVFATSINTTFTNAKLIWNTDDYKCPAWVFGDSYITLFSTNRWPHYVINEWNNTNFLLNGYPGANSLSALTDLQTALTHGTPKYILWTLGMNDHDTNSAVNENWLSATETLIRLCNEKGITLILCTIPNVTNTSYNNTQKNAWIRNSGQRYIDLATSMSNISDWLSNDGVHPNEVGARYMASVIITGMPELTQGK